MKRKMKKRFGNVKDAISELVRVTTNCNSIEQRVTKLKTYFKEKETEHESHQENDFYNQP